MTLDDPSFDAVLLINGCNRACKEKDVRDGALTRLVSVRDAAADPRVIIDALLTREGAK